MDKSELDYYMTLLRRGDETAFEIIYEKTKRGLFAFILSYCKNYHTAEDLMQSTYIKLRSSIDSYKPGSNAGAWLFTIAKNLTINEAKKNRREVSSDFSEKENEFGEYNMDENLTSPLLKTMRENLNETELRIVLLYLVSGFKHREIAQMLEKALGTVLWSYRNAIGKIKKALEAEENEN